MFYKSYKRKYVYVDVHIRSLAAAQPSVCPYHPAAAAAKSKYGTNSRREPKFNINFIFY